MTQALGLEGQAINGFRPRAINKVSSSVAEAVASIQSGSTILSSGFGMCGIPDTLLEALAQRPNINNLTVVSNNAGGTGKGLGRLFKTDQVSCMVSSFIGWDKYFGDLFLQGRIAVDLVPQGTMVERCRAGAFGIPAFYTAVGADTAVEDGSLVRRYANVVTPGGSPIATEWSKPRESRTFAGRKYILEEAIHGDVAFVRAWKADTHGNCVFRRTASNFGPVFGMNAQHTIVEAEIIVEAGELDADQIDLPAIFVDTVVQAKAEKLCEKPVFSSKSPTLAVSAPLSVSTSTATPIAGGRQSIAIRAAQEIAHGQYVNLGVGIPTLVADYLPAGVDPVFHSENGLLGVGPFPSSPAELDPDIINAGKESVTIARGGSCFDSSLSFGMIRGGHLSMSMLGALEVSASGDLANYVVPGSLVRGMGGAMDLVSCPTKTRIVALTEHVDKYGNSKIVNRCSLPLTGSRCVSRIITNLAVFDVDLNGDGPLTLSEVVSCIYSVHALKLILTFVSFAWAQLPGSSVQEIREKTAADFVLSAHLIRSMSNKHVARIIESPEPHKRKTSLRSSDRSTYTQHQQQPSAPQPETSKAHHQRSSQSFDFSELGRDGVQLSLPLPLPVPKRLAV